MKNKYERLSKEEQKKACDDFINSLDSNSKLYHSLKRLRVVGIFGMIYAALMFIFDLYTDAPVWSITLDAFIMIFSVGMIVSGKRVLVKQVNNYLINRDNNSKKKGK